MLKNERGSTLLVVMLMMLVFTVLGLSILSASIGGSKRTEIRETQVEDDLTDIKQLNEAVAFIKSIIEDEDKFNKGTSMDDFNKLIDEILEYKNRDGIKMIRDISIDSGDLKIEDLEKYFTRILEVNSGNYKQTVYITGMPSFLKYALGSRGELTLNGSVYLKKGNLYAKEGLNISTEARYVIDGKHLEIPTTSSSVFDTNENLLFLEKDNINFCKSDCYSGEDITGTFKHIPASELADPDLKVFNPTPPKYRQEETVFVDVFIKETFIEKLEETGFQKNEIEKLVNPNDDEHFNTASSKIKDITSSNITNDDFKNPSNFNAYFVQGEHVYFDTDNLELDHSKWIVIDGNAYFDDVKAKNNLRSIKANILVTGNVYIEGDLLFDSTMYVLGNTTINNASINKGVPNENILILMTEGELELARFNKFNDPGSNSINAYLYTASDAKVYAVGSSITIEGGLFANGDLEINAFRGNTHPNSNQTDLIFERIDNVDFSRFIIIKNEELFIDQKEGLPKVEKLEVITDLMEKE